jgi:histidine ammonia-lyase
MDLLLKSACIATAMSAQVMLGADTPFRADLHNLRPHAGAQRIAKRIFNLMKNSPIREAHRPYDIDGEVQDPYSLRCAAQILGACEELLTRAMNTLTTEANSVTDNPVILPKNIGGKERYIDIVSGGHFHGMPVAIDIYGLLQAAGILSTLINVRCQRYVDENRNKGLGADLKWPGLSDSADWQKKQSVWSGMMIPEYVSASLTNYIWGACMPTHLMSIPTDAGQEDHVSMAANLGLRTLDILPRLGNILALEFAFIAQAAAIRKQMDYIPSRIAHKTGGYDIRRYQWDKKDRYLNAVGEEILEKIYSIFPPVIEDRYMSEQIEDLSNHIISGDFANIAAKSGCL